MSKADIINLYKIDSIVRDSAKQKLVKAGYDQLEAEDLLVIADYNKARAIDKENAKKQKDLTKTDILGLVKSGVIDLAEGKKRLMKVGFDEQESEELLAKVVIDSTKSKESA